MALLLVIALFLFGFGHMADGEESEEIDDSFIYINEFLPNPVGDDDELEFIELYNASDTEGDISGWTLENGSGKTYVLPADTLIPADGYLVLYSAETGSMLANTGDRLIRLLDLTSVIQDEAVYSGSKEGYSYNRMEQGVFEQSENTTPNAANIVPPSPTPEPTVSVEPSPSDIPSPSPSAEPTPIPTPIEYSNLIYINEFLPNPIGDDAVGEYIELYNDSNDEIDLTDWLLDDVADAGSSPFTIPDGTMIPGKGLIVFYRPQTKIALNNDIDHVRLIQPDGVTLRDVSYSDTVQGSSHNRTDGEKIEKSSTLTPNAANIFTLPSSPTPKPKAEKEEESEGVISYDFSSKIFINEFIPNPDGSDTELEFIELKSEDSSAIRLIGWTLDDAEGGSSPYRFSEADVIAPGKILVFFRAKTKIALNNDEDTVRLIDPNGKIISSVHYDAKGVGSLSYNKNTDGLFEWSETVTPGEENTIYVQQKVSPTPKPKAVKKSTTKVTKTQSTSNPRVLAATAVPSALPWSNLDEEGEVTHRIVSTHPSSESAEKKQTAFMFFGFGMASMQLVSGIAHKERIWQK